MRSPQAGVRAYREASERPNTRALARYPLRFAEVRPVIVHGADVMDRIFPGQANLDAWSLRLSLSAR